MEKLYGKTNRKTQEKNDYGLYDSAGSRREMGNLGAACSEILRAGTHRRKQKIRYSVGNTEDCLKTVRSPKERTGKRHTKQGKEKGAFLSDASDEFRFSSRPLHGIY